MGRVPACFKHASVVPIYKKGDRSLATNYRPISLLPSLSKILERLVLTQLRHLVSQNPGNLILPPEEFAYRANHSCEDLLAIFVNDWQRALDRGHFVAIALPDLSKAFDSVPHDKLLLELQACGIGGNALEWFHTYLTDRSQAVKVPQQPIGPSYPCTQGVHERCLHLNASKTEFMILHRSPVDLNQHTLTVGNSTVSPCSSAKYLGLTIDNRLTFSRHIDLLVGKIAGKLKTFQRVRNTLDNRARRSFYISLIQTILLYGSNAFSPSLSITHANRLITISKRAERISFGYPPSAHEDMQVTTSRHARDHALVGPKILAKQSIPKTVVQTASERS